MGPKKRKTAQANAPVVHPPQPNSLDWMRDGLQCPVCLEDMKDPPIYSCENPRATPCARSVMKPLLGKRSHVLSAESHWRKEEISAWKASSTTCQIELPLTVRKLVVISRGQMKQQSENTKKMIARADLCHVFTARLKSN